MTREEIIKQFVKEHINWIKTSNGERTFDEFVADFAMSLITEAEDKAWNASRETELIISVDGWIEQTKYFTIKEWRKSHTK